MEISSIATFADYWSRIHRRTRRVIGCIPHEHFDWTYREGKFTFADLIRHLAALERHMFVENVCGRPSGYPGHGRELADGPDAVLAYYDTSHEASRLLIEALPDHRLKERCTTPGGAELAVWKWLRAMVEHEVHHRGQIYLYLGLLGVDTPPLYGLTAEEVAARSASPAAPEGLP